MDSYEKQFRIFHASNPQVYKMFKRFSLEAIEAGKKHLSAWLIINRMRWETEIVTQGDAFKINNNYIAYYSRMFMEEFPIYKGFFRTRDLRRGMEG